MHGVIFWRFRRRNCWQFGCSSPLLLPTASPRLPSLPRASSRCLTTAFWRGQKEAPQELLSLRLWLHSPPSPPLRLDGKGTPRERCNGGVGVLWMERLRRQIMRTGTRVYWHRRTQWDRGVPSHMEGSALTIRPWHLLKRRESRSCVPVICG